MAPFLALALRKDTHAPSRPRKKKPTPAQRRRALARVAAKRAYRQHLSQLAETRWTQNGHAARHAYLHEVRRALQEEGFKSTRLQWRHKGHSFGLVRDFGDKQIHVRVYENGIIDAEVEISKRYLQHLYSPRFSAHRVVQLILEKHDIPADLVNVHYVPKVGATRRHYPLRRIPVAHLVGVGVVASSVAASFARFIVRRKKGRSA